MSCPSFGEHVATTQHVSGMLTTSGAAEVRQPIITDHKSPHFASRRSQIVPSSLPLLFFLSFPQPLHASRSTVKCSWTFCSSPGLLVSAWPGLPRDDCRKIQHRKHHAAKPFRRKVAGPCSSRSMFQTGSQCNEIRWRPTLRDVHFTCRHLLAPNSVPLAYSMQQQQINHSVLLMFPFELCLQDRLVHKGIPPNGGRISGSP